MAKRKTLPKDFEQLVQTASDEDIKKVFGKCDMDCSELPLFQDG